MPRKKHKRTAQPRRSQKSSNFNNPFKGIKDSLRSSEQSKKEDHQSSTQPQHAVSKHVSPARQSVQVSQANTAKLSKEQILFLDAVGDGITPMGHDDDRVSTRTHTRPDNTHDNIQQQSRPNQTERVMQLEDEAMAWQEFYSLADADQKMTVQDDGVKLTGRMPGVNTVLVKQLSRGEIDIEARLDLHGMDREQARDALITFIGEARKKRHRCVLVITGQGYHSPDGQGVLRQELPRWLSKAPLRSHMLAFSSAEPKDGGAGAFYLLLKRIALKAR